jgi:hypothetical protein
MKSSSALLILILIFGLTLNYCATPSVAFQINVLASDVSMVPTITWNRTFTGSGLIEVDSIVQTADDGFLLAGSTALSPNSIPNIEVVKVDATGNLQWNKTYAAKGNPYSNWLIATNDGAYAIFGQYAGNYWLEKIDGKGNILWNQTYSGSGFSSAVALTQTNDGGYAMIGQTNLVGNKGAIWLVKTDALGNEQWNKTLGDGEVNSIIQTSDGGYALAGGIGNLPDYLLIKANSTGDLKWSKTYGSQDEDFAFSVVQTSDGGYALGGWMWLRSNGGGPNLAIVKTDALGNSQWTKYYGAGQARFMTKNNIGDFALVGTKLVIASASSGNEQWEVVFETNHEAYALVQSHDGSYIVAGSDTSKPIPEAWMAKISLTQVQPSSTPTATPPVPELFPWAITALIISITLTLVTLRIKHYPNSDS